MKLLPIYGLLVVMVSACSPDQSDVPDSAATQSPDVQTTEVHTSEAETSEVQIKEEKTVAVPAVPAQTDETLLAQNQNAEQQLRESVARLAPDMEITAIAESVMPGVYEVVSGAQVFYLTPDGRYMLCLLYTSPSPRDKRQSRMPSSA